MIAGENEYVVALLAEGVDRNILDLDTKLGGLEVALLAEGVDRNFKAVLYKDGKACRPPHGGRG